MTVEWLLRTLATGVLLGIAALAAERVAGWFGVARRWTWAAAMLGSLLLPFLALAAPRTLPEIGIPDWGRTPAGPAAIVSPSPALAPPAAPARAEVVLPEPPALPRVVLLGWLAASLAILGCVAWTCYRVGAARNGYMAARVAGARVLVSERCGPLVLGVLHPELLLPRWVLQAAPEERRLIVRHEREHVACGDPWLLAFATLAVALMPWNPALWAQHHRLRLAVETDCDARVLGAGGSRRQYGQVLLRTARYGSSFPVLAPGWGARTSDLERRIVAMTAKPPARRLLRALSHAVFAICVAATACDLAWKGVVSAAAPDPVREEPDSGQYAYREFGAMGVVIARGGPDSAVGYTGLSPYYAERRQVERNGVPVMQRVATFPVVIGIEAGSPAQRAGFRDRDVILAVNGRDSREPPAGPLRPGEQIVYRVRRNGGEIQLRLLVAAVPQRPWPPSEAEWQAAARAARLVQVRKP